MAQVEGPTVGRTNGALATQTLGAPRILWSTEGCIFTAWMVPLFLRLAEPCGEVVGRKFGKKQVV